MLFARLVEHSLIHWYYQCACATVHHVLKLTRDVPELPRDRFTSFFADITYTHIHTLTHT